MPTLPGFDPAAQRRALEAAKAAGAPLPLLAAVQGNQIAKLMTTVLQSSPLLRYEFSEQQLDPDDDEDGWTLVVRWRRPTADDVTKAGEMGLGNLVEQAQAPSAASADPEPEPPVVPDDVEVIR